MGNNDFVEYLRGIAIHEAGAPISRLATECADEIERLRSINADLYLALELIINDWDDNYEPSDRRSFDDKIDLGRAALTKAQGHTEG